MKTFCTFLVSLFLFTVSIQSQEPTYAGLPDSSHVLVVYNSNLGVSDSVKQYYVNARGIPSINIVQLTLPDTITIQGHLIKINDEPQPYEIIKDKTNEQLGTWIPTIHAWIYFNEKIVWPIRDALLTRFVNGIPLKDVIRYIVICKGVPFKLQAAQDWWEPSYNGQLVVTGIDGLLTFLSKSFADPDYYITDFAEGKGFSNPYNNADSRFTMEYRFLPHHFVEGNDTLSYLVSRLDGLSFEIVTDMIYRSVNADVSGNATWILDGDPDGDCSNDEFSNTKDILDLLGFDYEYDGSDTWLDSTSNQVIGYSSHGIHAEDNNPNWNHWDWVQSVLNFNYANGAIFNSFESFNGNSLGTLERRANHGLMTEFTLTEGTTGVCHAYEPGCTGTITNYITFPAYAIGYSYIDAVYMGMEKVGSQNIVVGDPLTLIFNNCEPMVISSNTTIGDGDYDCDIVVLEDVTLTIMNESVVNFKRNAKLQVYGNLEIEDNAELYFDAFSELRIESSGSVNIGSDAQMVFNDHAKYLIDHDFEVTAVFDFIFNDQSEFEINGALNMDVNSSLSFHDKSKLTIEGPFNLNAGSTMNFNNDSWMKVNGSLTSLGESSNKITFNLSNSETMQFNIQDGISLEIYNTVVNNNGIMYSISQGVQEPQHLSITNTTFNNPKWAAINLSLAGKSFQTIPFISNCTFNNCETGAMFLNQIEAINVENNSISLGSSAYGIYLKNDGNVSISDCIITGGSKGIATPIPPPDEELIDQLLCDLSITQCTFGSGTGIELNGLANPFSSVNINANYFENCVNGIIINAFSHPDPYYDIIPIISNNVISGYRNGDSEIGISLSNGDEVFVRNNSITNFLTGISLNTVTNPSILENAISTSDLNVEPLSGIFSVSSNGEIRKNTIQHHWFGIELGSSSPNIGANTITDNLRYGIYINDHSNPNLSEQIVGGDPYPLSGYNTIRENGECNFFPSYSELYLRFNSTVNLEKGCNTIADDREDPELHCNYLYLIDGNHVVGKVNAFRNYWGEVNGGNPEGRFGPSLKVNYGGWLTGPCTYTEVGSALLLSNSKGEVYDTVYASGEAPSEPTDIESRYAAANEYYYSNNFSQAKQEYQGIIEDYGDSTESLQAYNRLYSIANLVNSSPETFNQLKEFYLQKAGNQTDSIMVGTLTHLSDLCLVSAEEYLSAIENFDEIAQQNPNTDIALYRQIDALTTALLLPQDSTLNKGILGKYSVNGLSDYTNKLSELLKTRGKSGIESAKELLPTEYTLYQNYPNPFNPITTIKYDLPFASEVSLIIYDILGRKVKELVNTKQEAGRYEVQFNASNLASGVYIYQLIAENPSTISGQGFISSKKMILLK